jgi:hypothetical protein
VRDLASRSISCLSSVVTSRTLSFFGISFSHNHNVVSTVIPHVSWRENHLVGVFLL